MLSIRLLRCKPFLQKNSLAVFFTAYFLNRDFISLESNWRCTKLLQKYQCAVCRGGHAANEVPHRFKARTKIYLLKILNEIL